MVKIPIGKVDEVFRLNVCIYTIYIAAIERIWLENCTAMEGKKKQKEHLKTFLLPGFYSTL